MSGQLADNLGCDAMVGSLDFTEALASFLSRTFVGREVDLEQLAVLNRYHVPRLRADTGC